MPFSINIKRSSVKDSKTSGKKTPNTKRSTAKPIALRIELEEEKAFYFFGMTSTAGYLLNIPIALTSFQ